MKKVLLFLYLILLSASLLAQFTENGNYRDWNYSPVSVYGLVKIQNTHQREYFKLAKLDALSTRIQRFNAAGKLTSTTVVRFVNGKINSMSRTNRWGDTYEVVKFTGAGPNEFIVTRRSSGKNDMLPCKSARYVYRNNLLAEIRYYDYSNGPCGSGNGVAIIRYKRYDDKARFSMLQELKYLDASGMPVVSRGSDCHEIKYEYDEHCNKTVESYYGIDGEAITDRYGIFKIYSSYNEKDQLVRTELIGLDESRTRNSYGVSVTSYEYSNGFNVKTTRMDDQLKVTRAAAAGDGVASISYEFDESGNEINRYFYDEFGKPMNGNNGYHKVGYWYNAQNMLVAEEYFDKSLNPVNDRYRIHRYSYVRDNKGRVIQEAFFDKFNQPTKDPSDEVYMRKYKYDDFGRDISTSFWRDEFNPMPRWDGYYSFINVYNEEGQITEMTYLDQNGNLFKSTSGYSREVRRYNSDARLAERKWFDGATPSTLTNALASGYHAVRYSYDGHGRVSSLSYYDGSGNVTTARISLNDEEAFECSKVEFLYQGNRLVEERFYKSYSSSPFKVIDCIKNNYLSVSGISMGYANQ